MLDNASSNKSTSSTTSSSSTGTTSSMTVFCSSNNRESVITLRQALENRADCKPLFDLFRPEDCAVLKTADGRSAIGPAISLLKVLFRGDTVAANNAISRMPDHGKVKFYVPDDGYYKEMGEDPAPTNASLWNCLTATGLEFVLTNWAHAIDDDYARPIAAILSTDADSLRPLLCETLLTIADRVEPVLQGVDRLAAAVEQMPLRYVNSEPRVDECMGKLAAAAGSIVKQQMMLFNRKQKREWKNSKMNTLLEQVTTRV